MDNGRPVGLVVAAPAAAAAAGKADTAVLDSKPAAGWIDDMFALFVPFFFSTGSIWRGGEGKPTKNNDERRESTEKDR
eukprot:CAMPEP_0178729362 /NCGR_PEP_ID=MMETSP0699-20121125/28926_1 /TAXON_ID=265572 /ORGANISM="Extubocellulus spinifer, Strain CCMP396" /LENGTH=77 /DNA_ID=CAMNT_0020381277 /DNA_START=132 /DNA_END=366 /DNA_ORIENTATION=+